MSEDGVFDFPETLLQKLNWGIGDEIEWIEKKDGTFTLTKINGIASKKIERPHRASSKKKKRLFKMGAGST
jgi:hypothetical protein